MVEAQEILRAVLALIFVLGLIAVCAAAVRHFGWFNVQTGFQKTRRLALVDTLTIDPRHRLVLARRDETEVLIVIGPSGAQFAPTTFKAPSETAEAAEP